MTRLLVIGAVAAGTKTAAKARREHPEWQITVLEKGQDISYAGCGLPYFIGDVIKDRSELVVRTPDYFKQAFNIDVLVNHEATAIDPGAKTVASTNAETGRHETFKYDKLVIATGASPVVPPVPGIDLLGVHTVRRVTDAEKIKTGLGASRSSAPLRAVVVGGGMIGLEVAENLKVRGAEVSVVEMTDQVLPGFDPEMAHMVERAFAENGVDVYTSSRLLSFEPGPDGSVARAVTSERTIDCDLVIWATGVRPNTEIAKAAGVEVGPTRAIKVNANMETNVPDIYAVGDCAENVNLITGKPAWYPMGSTANKMGRIAALNLDTSRGVARGTPLPSERPALKGVLGTTVLKAFKVNAGKTGLSEKAARDEGFEVETVLVPANDRAHYYPGYKDIVTKLIADKRTHKVLGGQVVGEGVVDKPIDILATAITLGAMVEDLANLDLAYAPPFSMAMSSTLVAANVMLNKLSGRVTGIGPSALMARLGESSLVVVDVRTDTEVVLGMIPGAVHIPLGSLAESLDGLDRSKEYVLVCKVGLRAYLASNILKNAGFQNVRILDGGMTTWPYEVK